MFFSRFLLGKQEWNRTKKQIKVRKMTQEHVYRSHIGPGIHLAMFRYAPSTVRERIFGLQFFA